MSKIVRVTRGEKCFILIGTHNGKEEQVTIPDSEFRGCFYKYQMDFFNKFRSAFPIISSTAPGTPRTPHPNRSKKIQSNMKAPDATYQIN